LTTHYGLHKGILAIFKQKKEALALANNRDYGANWWLAFVC